MKVLFLLLLFCNVASPITHSLKFFFTGSSGVPNFPEFVGVVMVDEVEVIYYDNNIKKAELKQDWMENVIMCDPKHLDSIHSECLENENFFKENLIIWMLRFNQSGGVHILQRMYGCEWDDMTEEINGYDQYGYDGEDFIAFDLKTQTWVAPKPQSVITKNNWDNDKAKIAKQRNFLIQTCPDWLKKYVNFGKRSLLRTALPSVSLLQKTPSDPVSCFATGFFPDRADMFWRKDGVELHEDVDRGAILPNHNGSFQMSADLAISSVKPEDWKKYECVFQHTSGRDIITKLDKAVIRTNEGKTGIRIDGGSPSDFPAGPVIIRVVVVLVLLALCIAASQIYIWKMTNNV